MKTMRVKSTRIVNDPVDSDSSEFALQIQRIVSLVTGRYYCPENTRGSVGSVKGKGHISHGT